MREWTSGDVVANGIRMHYYRTGGEHPPLVLCHGFSDNGLCWTRVACALESDYDVVMYDARGHGFSEAPDLGHDSQTRAADLAGLVEALGLRPPRVMGHSMGASTAAVAAANYPKLWACAILEDPPWWADPERAWRERVKQSAERRATIIEQNNMTREALIARIRERSPHWHEDEIGPWADAKRQLSPKVIPDYPLPERSWREVVSSIACPILLVTADPQLGGLVTPEVAVEAASLWRRGRGVTIPGTGHSIHRDSFDAFMGEVEAFLSEIDARDGSTR